jgi:hypothetical protein
MVYARKVLRPVLCAFSHVLVAPISERTMLVLLNQKQRFSGPSIFREPRLLAATNNISSFHVNRIRLELRGRGDSGELLGTGTIFGVSTLRPLSRSLPRRAASPLPVSVFLSPSCPVPTVLRAVRPVRIAKRPPAPTPDTHNRRAHNRRACSVS